MSTKQSWKSSTTILTCGMFAIIATIWFLGGLALGMEWDDLKVALGMLITGVGGITTRLLMGKGDLK